ncbi:unnamed protein product [Linum trigynum]|uniref:Uncharacterized protein n=1 Tax=Linum trigynum TaxID=586398 RepID=A0AAV2E152_9ROSI
MIGVVVQATTEVEVVLQEVWHGKNTRNMLTLTHRYSLTTFDGLLGGQSEQTLRTPFDLGVLRMSEKRMLVMQVTMILLGRSIHSPQATRKVRKI